VFLYEIQSIWQKIFILVKMKQMKAYVSSVPGKYIYVFVIVLLGLTVCLGMGFQGDCGSHVYAFVTTQPLP